MKNILEYDGEIIPIVTGAFGTVTKRLLKRLDYLEIGGRVGTIQTTTLLGIVRILRRALERLEETCCYSNSSEGESAKTDGKNVEEVNNNNGNNHTRLDREGDPLEIVIKL